MTVFLVGRVEEILAKERVERKVCRGDGGEELDLVSGAGSGDVEDVGPLQKSASRRGALGIDDEGNEHGVALGSLKGMGGAGDEVVVS